MMREKPDTVNVLKHISEWSSGYMEGDWDNAEPDSTNGRETYIKYSIYQSALDENARLKAALSDFEGALDVIGIDTCMGLENCALDIHRVCKDVLEKHAALIEQLGTKDGEKT